MTSWSPTSASHANSRAGIGWEELVGARNTCSGAGYTSPFFLSFGGDAKRALAANGSMDWSARRNPVVCVPHPAARPPITLRVVGRKLVEVLAFGDGASAGDDLRP